MSTVNISYAASGALTITLASLATSSTLVAGRESTAVDNSSTLALDYLLSGKVTTGTSPAAGAIEVWVVGELDDSTWPDVFDGTDSNETVTSRDILTACGRLCASMVTGTTNDQTYYFSKTSVASLFGGVCPRKFVVFVTQNTTVNLNATGSNQAIYQEAITQTIT